ncbi:MAG: cytochrome B5 [Nitrospirae bacterium YQR-1]
MFIKSAKATIVALSVVIIVSGNSFAYSEFSEKTKKECRYCHIDSDGGGKLTAEGEAYKTELFSKGKGLERTTAQKIIRFIVGFLHITGGVTWFGAILYVHILLKPAYASRGLPRGELTLGWISICAVGITGFLLTIARISNLQTLFHTKFGVLLTIKILIYILMVTTAAIVTFFIGKKLKEAVAGTVDTKKGFFTPEEIAKCDGKDGRPAYVQYKGNIYDLTASRMWKDGKHAGKHPAGFDHTESLKQAPHGEDKLSRYPVVGELVQEQKTAKEPFHKRLFFFFVYMNLFLVFAVLFVISLWRWA